MGLLLKEELKRAGLTLANLSNGTGLYTEQYDAIVSYGVPVTTDKPCLNAQAGGIDKLTELKKLKDASVPVIPFAGPEGVATLQYPILRRKYFHKKGKDICLIRNPRKMRLFFKRDRFYTQVVPSTTVLGTT
jgi:hypothetical protein